MNEKFDSGSVEGGRTERGCLYIEIQFYCKTGGGGGGEEGGFCWKSPPSEKKNASDITTSCPHPFMGQEC